MAFIGGAERAFAAAAGCALLASPAAAQTPDVFSAFKRVCADNQAVYAHTTEAPEIQAWAKVPFPVPLPTSEAKLDRRTVRVSKTPKGVALFFAGQGRMQSGGSAAPFEMCAVGMEPTDFAGVVRLAEGMTGQAAIPGERGMRSFRWHEAADGRRTSLPAGKLREIAPKLGPGTLVSVDLVPKNKLTVVSYSTVKL
jgi:hypothetical protein